MKLAILILTSNEIFIHTSDFIHNIDEFMKVL